jgi:hypothetical protein
MPVRRLAGPSAQFCTHKSSPAATTAFRNGQTTASPHPAATSELPEHGTIDASFLTATLNQIRTEQPTLLAPLPSYVTDARLYRVFVDHAITGIHLKAAAVAPPPVTSGSCGGSNGTKLTKGANHQPLQHRHALTGLWQRPLEVVLCGRRWRA